MDMADRTDGEDVEDVEQLLASPGLADALESDRLSKSWIMCPWQSQWQSFAPPRRSHTAILNSNA